ncbi:MAG: histidine ammonia-lyase, partial [Gammaproteobacteria bacterium]|nr:histidine ammonia-lyase [Gammaproteobacteria bacterium]
INSLARGYSGVRPLIIEMLTDFYNHRIYPCIPAKGSVGASGDLAPLAHLSLPLIGEGSARFESKTISGQEALQCIGADRVSFCPKEGLALLNGTQVSTAIALFYLLKTKKLLNAAIKIGALCFDAAMGCVIPFSAEIHELRGQLGQKKVAERLRQLLANSEITQNKPPRVQDPYCLRCMPQVLGTCWDNLTHINSILAIEVNAVTDNPLIFSDTHSILSGGNFHAAPIAQAADFMAIILAEIGTLVERQIALLMDVHFNHGLPAFLADDPGLHSGFMVAQVTAAALTSANKSLAHPYSVDTIPTSANQEDHVSMATAAAWRLKDMVENTQYILAIALLAACRGIEFRRPLRSSDALEKIVAHVNKHIPRWEEERPLAPDIEKAALLVMEIDE